MTVIIMCPLTIEGGFIIISSIKSSFQNLATKKKPSLKRRLSKVFITKSLFDDIT